MSYNTDSNTTPKKSTNGAVRQLAVRQPIYNTDSMSQLDTQRETHSVSLSDREKILGLLKQDSTLLEQAEILKLLERIKEEGLVGNAMIYFRVSYALKELYDRYYAPKKPTLSPQTENIRRNILYSILDYLYEKFSNQDPKIQELFFKACEELGYPIGKVRKIKEEEKPPIILVQHIEEKAEKEEKEQTEFERKFREFETFLNELIFTHDNFVKERNGYPVTKPLAKKLYKYINEIVNLDSTPPEAKQLREIEEFLQKYTLNEKHFTNGIMYIPVGVHNEILSKLTKIEKLIS